MASLRQWTSGVAILASACSAPGPPAQTDGDADRSPDAVIDPPWTDDDDRELADWVAMLESAAGDSLATVAVDDTQPPENVDSVPSLEIHVFDLGQADATLVIGPPPGRRTLLIDLGEPSGGEPPSHGRSSAEHVLGRLEALTGTTHVDYFVLSHYHSDHAGRGLGRDDGWGTGIIGLLSNTEIPFSVGEFIHVGELGAEYMKPESSRSVFRHIKRRMPFWLRRSRVARESAPRFGTGQIQLGDGVLVDVLAFGGTVESGESALARAAEEGADYNAAPGNENDLSIALEISAGDFEFFTAGDLNGTDDPVARPWYVPRDFGETYANVERLLVDYVESQGRELDVEVYRANHHGSHYSSTQRLIDALDPEWVLYSTGGQYGHPAADVIRRAGGTAGQLATTWVRNLPVFVDAGGQRVGEIVISVTPDGRSYTIHTWGQMSYSDSAEAAGDDENGN